MDKTSNDIQQIVRSENFIPQIRRSVLILVFWHIIACATVMRAFIEWQEKSIFSSQLGRHIDFVLTHGKVYQCATLKHQQGFRLVGFWIFRQAGAFVLQHGILHRLFKLGLEFQSSNRKAVNEQYQVNTPFLGLFAHVL